MKKVIIVCVIFLQTFHANLHAQTFQNILGTSESFESGLCATTNADGNLIVRVFHLNH